MLNRWEREGGRERRMISEDAIQYILSRNSSPSSSSSFILHKRRMQMRMTGMLIAMRLSQLRKVVLMKSERVDSSDGADANV